MTLIKRVRTDAIEAERLRKERDDLLRAVEELRTGIDLARQEHANAQQRINHLEDELQRERDLKVVAEGVSAGLTTEVEQRQEEVRCLEAKVTLQCIEVCSFGRTWTVSPRFPLLSLPGIRGKPFDTVGM